MKARLVLQERHILDEDAFAELVIWELPGPVPGSRHQYKYRLAFVVSGRCVLRYDNEAGKGDHRHIGRKQFDYSFTTPAVLFDDFFKDVTRWRNENRNS